MIIGRDLAIVADTPKALKTIEDTLKVEGYKRFGDRKGATTYAFLKSYISGKLKEAGYGKMEVCNPFGFIEKLVDTKDAGEVSEKVLEGLVGNHAGGISKQYCITDLSVFPIDELKKMFSLTRLKDLQAIWFTYRMENIQNPLYVIVPKIEQLKRKKQKKEKYLLPIKSHFRLIYRDPEKLFVHFQKGVNYGGKYTQEYEFDQFLRMYYNPGKPNLVGTVSKIIAFKEFNHKTRTAVISIFDGRRWNDFKANYDNPNVFRGFDGHIIISSEAQEIYIREFGSEEEQNLRIVDVLELKEIKEKRKNTKKIKTKKRK